MKNNTNRGAFGNRKTRKHVLLCATPAPNRGWSVTYRTARAAGGYSVRQHHAKPEEDFSAAYAVAFHAGSQSGKRSSPLCILL